jgi:hypothetical protein
MAGRTHKQIAEDLHAGAWNTRHPNPGIEVDVTMDDGRVVRTRTRSAAEVLGGHTAVIWLDPAPDYAFRGCYKLDRVRAVSPKPEEHP